MTAGFPEAAARLRAAAPRVAARALEVAIDHDSTLAERHPEAELRQILRDTAVLVERVALSVASGSPRFTEEWTDWVIPLYRRRRVPLDDISNLCEGVRSAVGAVLAPGEQEAADTALDAAVAVLRWNRRIAGDARKRNRLATFLYKGA
jgi:hypothetical protein